MMDMRRLLTVLFSLALVLLVGLIVVAYFLGNVPVVSQLLGTNKQVDLGVRIGVDHAYEGLKKLKMPTTYDELAALASSPQSFKSVKTVLSQEEASSLVALGDIPGFPLKLTQIRFNADGTVETSGVLDTAEARAFLISNGVSADVVGQIGDYFRLAGRVNYYAKGAIKIDNNRVSLDVSSAKIGNIPVPGDLGGYTGAIEGEVSRILVRNEFNVRTLTTTGGKVELDVDRPLSSIVPWLDFVQR
jgi:hypothetical protein